MNNKQSQEPAPDIKAPAMIPAEPASRDYVDAKHAEGTAFTESVKSYIATHFVGVLLAFLALILAFVWYLHNDLKQQMQAIHNKLNILIQAHPIAKPQAKPTSL